MNTIFFTFLMIIFSLSGMADTASAVAQVDSGNTSWLLTSSALVMLMTPGLAFFYAGMVSKKNVISTLLQNYAALAVVGVIWVVIGYSLVFSTGGGFLGGTNYFMLKGLTNTMLDPAISGANVPTYAYMAFQMMFAVITPALITGAIAERVSFKGWLLVMGLWSLVVYSPVAHWLWGPDGWVIARGGLDFAGGMVVHMTAGYSALVAALLYGKRVDSGETKRPYDVPMIMLGAGLLWFGWFGFNAGSAVSSGSLASHAFVTTYMGAASAMLCWMMVDWAKSGKASAVGASVGLVLGLVVITPGAGFVSLEHAMFMCGFSAIVANLAARALKKITKLDDSLEVFACHGIGGTLGAFFTALFASKVVNPSIVHEGFLVSGDMSLLHTNLMGIAAVAVLSLVGTFVIIKVVNIFTPIRVSKEAEHAGLDVSEHGETVNS